MKNYKAYILTIIGSLLCVLRWFLTSLTGFLGIILVITGIVLHLAALKRMGKIKEIPKALLIHILIFIVLNLLSVGLVLLIWSVGLSHHSI